jgi:hypothetical protein
MKMSMIENPSKRKLIALLALLACLAGCYGTAQGTDGQQKRFKGMPLVLVVDAVPGAEMERVVFTDDRGVCLYSHAAVSRRVRSIAALGGSYVPRTVRVMWRTGAGWDEVRNVWHEGVLVGDYTIPVAGRIPDDVLHDIRAHGGGLRLKFRLKPDGVLFGWDIERAAPLGDVSIFEMPGGDFLETRY